MQHKINMIAASPALHPKIKKTKYINDWQAIVDRVAAPLIKDDLISIHVRGQNQKMAIPRGFEPPTTSLEVRQYQF
jgi:hypothetical protein